MEDGDREKAIHRYNLSMGSLLLFFIIQTVTLIIDPSMVATYTATLNSRGTSNYGRSALLNEQYRLSQHRSNEPLPAKKLFTAETMFSQARANPIDQSKTMAENCATGIATGESGCYEVNTLVDATHPCAVVDDNMGSTIMPDAEHINIKVEVKTSGVYVTNLIGDCTDDALKDPKLRHKCHTSMLPISEKLPYARFADDTLQSLMQCPPNTVNGLELPLSRPNYTPKSPDGATTGTVVFRPLNPKGIVVDEDTYADCPGAMKPFEYALSNKVNVFDYLSEQNGNPTKSSYHGCQHPRFKDSCVNSLSYHTDGYPASALGLFVFVLFSIIGLMRATNIFGTNNAPAYESKGGGRGGFCVGPSAPGFFATLVFIGMLVMFLSIIAKIVIAANILEPESNCIGDYMENVQGFHQSGVEMFPVIVFTTLEFITMGSALGFFVFFVRSLMDANKGYMPSFVTF